MLWRSKSPICWLKIWRSSLKEFVEGWYNTKYVLKFHNNIIITHKIGAFGGKLALWDFI